MSKGEKYREFWKRNEKCLTEGEEAPRVPVGLSLGGDWICELLGCDWPRFHSDYEYQRDMRSRASEIAEREWGRPIPPTIDFGVIMDSSIYGGKWQCEHNATPVLTHAVEEPEDIDALIEQMYALPDPLEAGLLPQFLEWCEKFKRDNGFPMLAGTSIKGCPTMLGQILGITNFLTWMLTDQEPMGRLIECWYDTSARYLRALRRATGVTSKDKFSIFSDLTGVLSPDLYGGAIKEKERMLYEEFAPGPAAKRFYHGDYHMTHQLRHLEDIGVNELNVDPYVSPKELLAVIPDAVIYGQIPPLTVLLNGTPEEVRECVRRDIAEAGPGRHLVLDTAGSINAGTGFENLRAVLDAVEEFGYIY